MDDIEFATRALDEAGCNLSGSHAGRRFGRAKLRNELTKSEGCKRLKDWLEGCVAANSIEAASKVCGLITCTAPPWSNLHKQVTIRPPVIGNGVPTSDANTSTSPSNHHRFLNRFSMLMPFGENDLEPNTVA